MDIKKSPARLAYDPITSPHLRSALFEKLDKDHFLNSYIQSQKQHAETYAANGELVYSSWKRTSPASPEPAKPVDRSSLNYGFSTPVLKARVAMPADASVATIEDLSDTEAKEQVIQKRKNKRSFHLAVKPKTTLATIYSSSKLEKENPPSLQPDSKIKNKSKKRKLSGDSDEEYAARESYFLCGDFYLLFICRAH